MNWRSYSEDGSGPLRDPRPITELDVDHLENILITQVHLTPEQRSIILRLLRLAYEKGDAEQWDSFGATKKD
jgi:hypothetical protein